jgi:hypothetical protein
LDLLSRRQNSSRLESGYPKEVIYATLYHKPRRQRLSIGICNDMGIVACAGGDRFGA